MSLRKKNGPDDIGLVLQCFPRVPVCYWLRERFQCRSLSLAILALLLSADSLWAEEAVTEAPSSPPAAAAVPSTATDDSPLVPPAAFRKADPQSLADLRQMESHVVQLVKRAEKSTVCLRVGRAFGSGVVVTEDGLILTAGHVVGKPGRRVEVTFSNGDKAVGTSLGRDRALDSGMVQLPKDRKWPFAPMAPADSFTAGSWCLALGHPGGYDDRRGIVARLGRVIASRKRFIQTDCELVGGDSGGPLFDMRGRVIAVHSRIGESTNFNFHVPATIFKDEWDRLVAGEDFAGHSGALLGITGKPNPNGPGLVVTKVHEGEPAEKAGIVAGDIVILFESKKVQSLDQLIDFVGEEMPGQTVVIDVLREGKAQRFRVELGMRWD